MASKMIVIPTRSGEIIYECFYCKTTMIPELADTHTCKEDELWD